MIAREDRDRFRDQGQKGLRKGLMITALSGIDVALWDLEGKYFEAPVRVLMGGAPRTRARLRDGAYRQGAADAIDDIVAEVRGCACEGFAAVKIKIGFDVAKDVALVRACREAVGAGVALMLDANHGYDAVEAAAFGVRCVPHVRGKGVGLAAAPQLIAVIAGNPPRDTPLAPMLEFDSSEHRFRRAVLTAPIEADAGMVVVPEAVGLGIASDRGALERFRKTPDRC